MREGTRVLCPNPSSPPTPPHAGGKGQREGDWPEFSGVSRNTTDFPPACGGVGGEISATSITNSPPPLLVPIENLHPGDWVYSHDGKPHPITDVVVQRYVGPVFWIVREDGRSICLMEDELVLTQRRVRRLTPSGGWSGIPHDHFQRARTMRQAMTPPELVVWNLLRGNQISVKFRKQHPIGPYIADFYCRECGLVVEIDGAEHFETRRNEIYDRRRDEYMKDLGLTVLRFTTHDVGRNIDAVLASIYEATHERVLDTDPTLQWRYPEAIRLDDALAFGAGSFRARVCNTFTEGYSGTSRSIRAEATHSVLTEFCAVHEPRS